MTVLTIALAILGIMVLVVLHEAGHAVAAKAVGMRVEQVALFFGPKLWRRRRGETEYALGTIPLGGYAKITGMNPDEELDPEVAPRAYYNRPVWQRVFVILAGPAVNLVIAFLVLFGTAFVVPHATELQVASVQRGAPADGKLQKGDLVLAVDGERGEDLGLIDRATRFQTLTDAHACPGGEARDGCRAATPARLEIVRNGEVRELEVRPFYDAETERNRIGFGFEVGRFETATGAGEAAGQSLDEMWRITSATVSIFARIFEAEQREQLGSVVGAVEVTRQAIEIDVGLALRIIGIVSLSLALINLLPFLPLDGGHVFWSLVEKLRGRRVPYAVMERASVLGFLLVLVVFYIGLTNDLERFSNGELDLR